MADAFEIYERASKSTRDDIKNEILKIIKDGEDAKDIISDICKYFGENYENL